ncbi:ParB/RepB/Spo0J family partition protein, partial [Bacillus cereus]
HGLIQPIVVRQYEDDKYEIIAGERRFRAATKLGWEKVPAIIKNLNDTETASVALIENLQREELTAIEEAVAYQKLIELHN